LMRPTRGRHGAGFCRPRFLLAVAALAWLTACSSRQLEHTQPSARDLAQAIMSAVAGRDEARLRSLALDEQEFKAIVWPSLPAARPERNLPFSYVWGDLKQKSDQSLRGILADHGGRKYQLRDVKFAGSPREYAGFRVHNDATFVAVDGSGAQVDLRVCGSFIEANGRWKAFSYAVDR
jgi:hypothetical protein